MVITMFAGVDGEDERPRGVDVIAVRHRLVAAAGTGSCPKATHFGGATDRVAFADLDDVLFIGQPCVSLARCKPGRPQAVAQW